MDGVGFTAHLKITGMPLVMPPFTPPLLFVIVTTFPISKANASYAAFPLIFVISKPLPNSTPLMPPIENSACESMLSTLSNHGSPTPSGSPIIAVSVTPPTLSPSAFAFSISSCIFFPCALSITGNVADLTVNISFLMSLNGLSCTFAHSMMCVAMLIPMLSSALFTIEAAATIPAVTRPEKCPPPR